jgi:hypothetical protein
MAEKHSKTSQKQSGAPRGGAAKVDARHMGTELVALLKQRLGELAGVGQREPGAAPRSRMQVVLAWVAAVPLLLGGLACIGLATQTIKELRGPASANGSPDWLLALAACFFVVMVASLFAAAFMIALPGPRRLPIWVVTLVVGIGGSVLGAQQLAEADWKAFTNAGSGAAVFLVLSVYLTVVSAIRLWALLRRGRTVAADAPDESDDGPAPSLD